MTDIVRVRRESIRWQILLTLNNARPLGALEGLVLAVVQAEYPDSSLQEVRRELGYVSDRELVNIDKQPDGRWKSEITRHGVDLVEYTIPIEPGIGRPEKYF